MSYYLKSCNKLCCCEKERMESENWQKLIFASHDYVCRIEPIINDMADFERFSSQLKTYTYSYRD